MFDTKIIEIENRRGAEKVQLAYVRYLYSIAKDVEVAPDWENCFNIATPKSSKIDDSYLDVILNTVASKLVHINRIAIEIIKLSDNEVNVIFVKVENA